MLDVVPLFETFADLQAAPRHPRRDRRASRLQGAPGRHRPPPRGHARVLRLVEGRRAGRRDPGPLRGPGRDLGVGAGERHRAHPVPRARRRARPWRRTREHRDPRSAAALGRRPVQAHRAGRGHLRPLRRPRHRDAAHRPGGRRGAARLVAVDRAAQPRRGGALRRGRGDDGCRVPRALLRAREGPGLRAVVRAGHADGGDRAARPRLPPRTPRAVGRVARGSPRHPVGLRVDARRASTSPAGSGSARPSTPSATRRSCAGRTTSGRCSARSSTTSR